MSVNTYLPPSPVVPMFLLISAISQSNPMVITVSTPNNYQPSQLARLNIPPDYGMPQANGITAQVLSVNGNNLTMAVNSTNFDPFVIPTQNQFTPAPASLSPAGSRNSYFQSYIPFHSLNGNVGN